MKKVLICLSMLLTMALSSVTAHAIAGDGSAESPYIITTQEELCFINDFPADNFVLGNDITLTGSWEALCTYADDFTGTFDGRGHTISDLELKNADCVGLFKTNKGTIKNLTVKTVENGFRLGWSNCNYSAGLIAYTNYGTISNCHTSGKIISYSKRSNAGVYYNTEIGTIVCLNYGKIEDVASDVNILKSADSDCIPESAGIAYVNGTDGIISKCAVRGHYVGYNAGIAYSNYGKISNSYFIGSAGYGIAYEDKNGTIENCYSAATNATAAYGILYSASSTSTTGCFYDRNLTSATSTAKASPKTTMAMKMKKTFTNADWDFDTIWGIDANINNGYPYLLWEYPDAEPSYARYTLNSITLKNSDGTQISEIPNGSFYVSVNATKNDNSKNSDALVIAVYDADNALMDIKFMSGVYYQNQSVTFGAKMNNDGGNIASLKAFVWDSTLGMIPLSNTIKNN